MQLSTAGKALVVLEHVRYIIGILIPGYFTARAAVSHESRIESCSRWLKYWSVCAALTAIETSVLGQLGWWAFISSSQRTEIQLVFVGAARLALTQWLAYGEGATNVYAHIEMFLRDREALIEVHAKTMEEYAHRQFKELADAASRRALDILKNHAVEIWRVAQCYATAKAAASEFCSVALEKKNPPQNDKGVESTTPVASREPEKDVGDQRGEDGGASRRTPAERTPSPTSKSKSIASRVAERRRARHFPKLETTREQRRQSSLDRALAPVRGAGIIVDCTLRFASVLEKMNIVRTPSKSIAYPPIPLVAVRSLTRAHKRITLVVVDERRPVAFNVSTARSALTLADALEEIISRSRQSVKCIVERCAARLYRDAFDAWFTAFLFRPRCLDDL